MLDLNISIYTKKVYEELWVALLDEGSVDMAIKLLRDAWLNISKQSWFKISVPRGVKGNFGEYTEDAKKGGHIAATLYMIEHLNIKYNPMVKPRTVEVKPKMLGGAARRLPVPRRIALLNGTQEPPALVQKEMEIDFTAQADVILKAPFELIVLSLGRQWSEVATGTRQTTLDTAFEMAEVDKEIKDKDLEDDFSRLLANNI